jgi:hypothetical protein
MEYDVPKGCSDIDQPSWMIGDSAWEHAEGTKSDCGVRNQSLDVRSTTLLVRQYVGSRCA